MKASILCSRVRKDEYVPGLMIVPCDTCKKSVWLYLMILIKHSDVEIGIICTVCYYVKRRTAQLSGNVRRIRILVEKINAAGKESL